MNATDELSPRELTQRLHIMQAMVEFWGTERLGALLSCDVRRAHEARRYQRALISQRDQLRTMLKAAAVAGVLALALLLSPGDGAGGWWVQCWPGLGGVPVCASGGSAEA